MKFRKPMSAMTHDPVKRPVVAFPCLIQPKLDGVRCITDGETFWSKTGKVFWKYNTLHLRRPMAYLVDGEIMLDDTDADFEDIISVLKRKRHERSHELRFHVFDMITDKPFVERSHDIVRMFRRLALTDAETDWIRVPTMVVNLPSQLDLIHQSHLKNGHEGSMIRTANGLYVSKRSKDLLKWKPLRDGEFEIVGVKQAQGKDAGTPIFVCECFDNDGDPKTFRVRPMGTTAQRRKMWNERKRLIGKELTVEYQNLTRHGKPRFPRAKVLRDYE